MSSPLKVTKLLNLILTQLSRLWIRLLVIELFENFSFDSEAKYAKVEVVIISIFFWGYLRRVRGIQSKTRSVWSDRHGWERLLHSICIARSRGVGPLLLQFWTLRYMWGWRAFGDPRSQRFCVNRRRESYQSNDNDLLLWCDWRWDRVRSLTNDRRCLGPLSANSYRVKALWIRKIE